MASQGWKESSGRWHPNWLRQKPNNRPSEFSIKSCSAFIDACCHAESASNPRTRGGSGKRERPTLTARLGAGMLSRARNLCDITLPACRNDIRVALRRVRMDSNENVLRPALPYGRASVSGVHLRSNICPTRRRDRKEALVGSRVFSRVSMYGLLCYDQKSPVNFQIFQALSSDEVAQLT